MILIALLEGYTNEVFLLFLRDPKFQNDFFLRS